MLPASVHNNGPDREWGFGGHNYRQSGEQAADSQNDGNRCMKEMFRTTGMG